MSARWDDVAPDVPIGFMLTDRAWHTVHLPELLTTAESAARAGVDGAAVSRAAQTGQVEGQKVEGRWLIDRDSLDAWAERHRRLPAGPLLRLIAARGGAAACGVEAGSADEQALARAAAEGSVTVSAGDHLAVRLLGLTLWEVWADALS